MDSFADNDFFGLGSFLHSFKHLAKKAFMALHFLNCNNGAWCYNSDDLQNKIQFKELLHMLIKPDNPKDKRL